MTEAEALTLKPGDLVMALVKMSGAPARGWVPAVVVHARSALYIQVRSAEWYHNLRCPSVERPTAQELLTVEWPTFPPQPGREYTLP
jgi:hypothetical protein